jgi:phosphomannomutase
VSRRVTDLSEIGDMMTRLRSAPPTTLAGATVTVRDLNTPDAELRTDAVELTSERFRVIVRPSGTEPKLKAYLEVVEPVATAEDLAPARTRAADTLESLADFARSL